MEEPPAIPNDNLWQTAEDALDTKDPLADKLIGIHSSLMAWRATGVNAIPDARLSSEKRRDRNDTQLWLFSELEEFFTELKRARRLCHFTIGESAAIGHRLARLGEGYALFKTGFLEAGSSYTLDYAERHRVPQDASFDHMPGLMDALQVYVGDTRREVAISLNQLALTLRDNARLSLL